MKKLILSNFFQAENFYFLNEQVAEAAALANQNRSSISIININTYKQDINFYILTLKTLMLR